DDVLVFGSFHELPVGLYRVGGLGSPQRAGRQVHVRGLYRRLDLVDADAAGGELVGVQLDTDRVLLRAVDHHLRDARDGRNALRHERLAVLVELVDGDRGRGDGDVEDGLVRRVHLLV